MDKVLYRHMKPCGEVFYIGIGNKYRPYSKDYRNTFWQKITNKYPEYEVQILKSNLTWEDACELEKILISWYGRRDLNKGTLCNMTDGGDGVNNKIWTKHSRKKASISATGKKMSKEAKEKMSKFWKNSKNSNRSNIVLDTQNGIFYNSLKEASQYYKFSYSCLVAMILGQNPNKSNLIYV